MKRIDALTDEQAARMALWAGEWIERGLDTSPVDWVAWEGGVQACYGYAGIPWPGVVVRVPNPLVGTERALGVAVDVDIGGAVLARDGKVAGAVRKAAAAALRLVAAERYAAGHAGASAALLDVAVLRHSALLLRSVVGDDIMAIAEAVEVAR